ncbi:FecR family protein [Pseudovibrio ascidiaceicola]|uniref:FecR family protein n=1 Tax=Pseudovibrio ascidiaceicola TaxID=285279 RepID=A0A1I4FW36_9HYPH|nr:FecR domain-containing protein [Pseudovibrio ascidiaceicola]SFL20901.1 FecR family protein [Pseudovibrio ascidiaceicola]
MKHSDRRIERRSTTEDAAIDWFILLEEYPEDPQVTQEFESWLNLHPEHSNVWQRVTQTSSLLGQLGQESLEPNVNKAEIAQLAVAHKSLFAKIRPYLAAGFACIFLLLSSISLIPHLMIWIYADHKTDVAQSKEIRLQDGSKIYLSAYSAVDLNFAADQRKVNLMRGEVLFDVAPDADRPFVVTTGDTTTTVLGTRFNINKGRSMVSVGVKHGHVEVAQASNLQEKLDLRASEWASLNEHGKQDVRTVNQDYIAAWRQDKLYVEDQSFEDVLFQLRRYMKIPVIVLDPRLMSKRVTGVFNLNEPRQSLDAISAAHSVQLRDFGFFVAISMI